VDKTASFSTDRLSRRRRRTIIKAEAGWLVGTWDCQQQQQQPDGFCGGKRDRARERERGRESGRGRKKDTIAESSDFVTKVFDEGIFSSCLCFVSVQKRWRQKERKKERKKEEKEKSGLRSYDHSFVTRASMDLLHS
jgi:hypothetical protein